MHNTQRLATVEASVSLILSIFATIYSSFYGIATERISNGEAIIAVTGQFEPISVVWVILPLIGLVGIIQDKRKIVTAVAFTMLLTTVLALLSIGLYFLPASFLLIIAAVTYSRKKNISH